MPRKARIKGPECTYHIIGRGNNKQKIFLMEEDKIRFLKTIKKFKIKYDFRLYAYVLMDNHIHIIINSNGEDISKIMQSINISYTYYFNRKYFRSGHLFQDRFKSIIVEDDSYLINLSKYIHNNPKRAGIIGRAEDYEWSSCSLYTSYRDDIFDIVDTELILSMVSDDKEKAGALYLNYMDDDEADSEKKKDLQMKPHFYTKNKKINSKIINISEMLNVISNFYKLPINDILLKNNRRHSFIRYECLYIIRLKSGESIKNIGKIFGEVCESAVSYGINKTIDRMMVDNSLLRRINGILRLIA